MADEFSIAFHVARRFVEVRFTGFWSIATVEDYALARRAMVAALAARGCPLASCTMLIDARALQAQPLDSVAAFAWLIGGATDHPARSALLVGSALFAMQGHRMALPNQRMFRHCEEAMAWLANPLATAA